MDLHTLQEVYKVLSKEYKICREMLEDAILDEASGEDRDREKTTRWANIANQARVSRQLVAMMIEKEIAERDEFVNREENLRELFANKE